MRQKAPKRKGGGMRQMACGCTARATNRYPLPNKPRQRLHSSSGGLCMLTHVQRELGRAPVSGRSRRGGTNVHPVDGRARVRSGG